MEVLISMFVTMIGLMGVAAMIPLGHFEINEGSKADYASALGRAAYRDLKVRGGLRPASWSDAAGTALVRPDGIFTLTNSNRVIPFVCLDPLCSGPFGSGHGFGDRFPAVVPMKGSPPNPRATIPRISLWPNPAPPAVQTLTPALRQAMAEQMFMGRDDLLLNLPDDGDQPAGQLFSASNAAARRLAAEDYSWLVTLAPNLGNVDNLVTVSVVVLHRRVLNPLAAFETDPKNPTDNASWAEASVPLVASPNVWTGFPGGGIGGGDVVLDVSRNSPNLKAGQWVALTVVDARQAPAPTINALKWYRVAAAGEVDPATRQRQITLAGADWPVQLAASNPNLVHELWILDGAIAVYEKHLRLEGPSLWSP
jgi:hypothetical protein